MNTALVCKFKHKKHMGSKGLSSIVGAIFMLLIVGVLASTYCFFTLNENTEYNNAIRETNSLYVAKISENIQALNTSYTVSSSNTVNVRVNVQNIGSSSVELVTLWLHVIENPDGNNLDAHNYITVDITLSAGESLIENYDIAIPAVTPTGSYAFSAWFITSRGNNIALRQLNNEDIVIAQTTQGIGALAMDFEDFSYYTVSGTGPYPLQNPSSAYYVQQARDYRISFRVLLTNFDQQKRDITLSRNSMLFIMYPSGGGNALSDRWYIVSVLNNQILTNVDAIVLHYNQPTYVYFSSSSRTAVTPATSSLTASQIPAIGAVNLALIGQIGGHSFGQNIPFVSIEVAS